MSRQQRKRIWVVVALLVALIGYLPGPVLLGVFGLDTFLQLISGEIDFFFIPLVCYYSTPLFCGFLILLLGNMLKYWIPFFGSSRRTETPDPSKHHPGQDDNARA